MLLGADGSDDVADVGSKPQQLSPNPVSENEVTVSELQPT